MSTLLAGYTLGTVEPIFLPSGDGVWHSKNWWKGTPRECWKNIGTPISKISFKIGGTIPIETYSLVI
jgi:hypothetical protein